MLAISTLGPFALYIDERPLTQLTSQKAQALLIYLAVGGQQVHQRDALMTLFWPDYPQKSAQQSLRQTLYRLRQAIEPNETEKPLILSERATIALNPEAALRIDTTRFEQLSGHGRTPQEWQQAVDLYQGEFLSDFYLPDSEPFEAWAAGKRAFYRRRMQKLLKRSADFYLERGDLAAAETAVRRQLELDNLQETAHRQLMEIMVRDGRRQEALTHYDSLHKLLQNELEIEPDVETISLVEAIRNGNLAEIISGQARQTIMISNEQNLPSHNLPHLLTSFIGREKELVEVEDLVKCSRLVTLTGVGGIGKTTLSFQAGHQLLEIFADGVWLVELAPIADPMHVAKAVAYALGLRDSGTRPIIESLLFYLQQKTCLLILDNCEHVIHAAAQFSETLLKTCPDLKILASSRETFGVLGEKTFQVPPLSLPDIQQGSSLPLAEWAQYDAVTLFVDRATAVSPDFQLSENNLRPLLHICQQLDGLPLAIELAAARVRVLTIEQIAARLDDRFRLLTSGSPTALPRQQTLRASIDWSWELLTPAEQLLLQSLSVFAGGISLDAVEAVCASEGLNSYDLLDLLDELVKKSLLITQSMSGQERRYRLLETIRQYAHEQLAGTGLEAPLRDCHLAYYLQLAEQAEVALVGPGQAAWLEILERELDNIRAALSWAQKTNSEAGLKLTTAIWLFWQDGYLREGNAYLAHFLSDEKTITLPSKARALWVRSRFSLWLAHLDRALSLAEECVALCRDLGDQREIALGLSWLGELLTYWDTEQEKSWAVLDESLALYRTLGDKLGTAYVLCAMGWYAREAGEYDHAQIYLEESASLYRESGDLAGLATVLSDSGWIWLQQEDFITAQEMLDESLAIRESLGPSRSGQSLNNLGQLYYYQGDYVKSRHFYERSIFMTQRTGQILTSSFATAHLGYVFLQMGEMARARSIFMECLQQFSEIGLKVGIAYVLEGFANMAVRQGQTEKALAIIAWCDAARVIIKKPRPPKEQTAVDQDLAAIREMIDEEMFAAAYAAGQALPMEEVIALARRNYMPSAST